MTDLPEKKEPLVALSSLWHLPEEILIELKQWYLAKYTYQLMSAKLAERGYHAHPSKIHHWCRDNLRGLANDNGLVVISDDDYHAMETQALSSCLDLCLEAIRSIRKTPQVRTIQDLNQLIACVARIISAATTRDRVELEKHGALRKLQDQFKSEVQQILVGRPDLVAKLHEVIDVAAEKRLVQ